MHLPPVHEQAAPVRAGGDAGRLRVLDQFVRKALVDGLAACAIGRVRHHVRDHRGRQPGLARVDLHLHLVPRLLLGGLFPQLVGVVAAPQEGPAFVDHDEAGGIDLDRIAGAHDKTAAAHGNAVHDAGKLRAVPRQLPQAVVDHIGRAGVAAVAVHADSDGRAAGNLLEILQKLGEQDVLPLDGLAPPVRGLLLVDVSIHGDLSITAVHRGHRIDLFRDADGGRLSPSSLCRNTHAHYLFSFQISLDGM